MMYSTDENQKPVPPLLVNESRDGQNEEVTMMENESFALLNEGKLFFNILMVFYI